MKLRMFVVLSVISLLNSPQSHGEMTSAPKIRLSQKIDVLNASLSTQVLKIPTFHLTYECGGSAFSILHQAEVLKKDRFLFLQYRTNDSNASKDYFIKGRRPILALIKNPFGILPAEDNKPDSYSEVYNPECFLKEKDDLSAHLIREFSLVDLASQANFIEIDQWDKVESVDGQRLRVFKYHYNNMSQGEPAELQSYYFKIESETGLLAERSTPGQKCTLVKKDFNPHFQDSFFTSLLSACDRQIKDEKIAEKHSKNKMIILFVFLFLIIILALVGLVIWVGPLVPYFIVILIFPLMTLVGWTGIFYLSTVYPVVIFLSIVSMVRFRKNKKVIGVRLYTGLCFFILSLLCSYGGTDSPSNSYFGAEGVFSKTHPLSIALRSFGVERSLYFSLACFTIFFVQLLRAAFSKSR